MVGQLPPKNLLRHIEGILNDRILELTPAGGGCISPALLVETEERGLSFLKWNYEAPDGFFLAEATGLRALGLSNTVKVPAVLATAEQKDGCPAFILLEGLVQAAETRASAETLGKQLAELHRQTTEAFGFELNNFIGSLPQENSWKDEWPEFFLECRIQKQAELGSEAGWFNGEFEQLLQQAAPKIQTLLDENPEPPALLHGDLWSGNVFWSANGPALIDPAVYYGHREADLAFTEMFGRLPEAFYRSYDETYPIDGGYEKRKPILNLYHLMTHSNLFGGSYISGVRRTLKGLL